MQFPRFFTDICFFWLDSFPTIKCTNIAFLAGPETTKLITFYFKSPHTHFFPLCGFPILLYCQSSVVVFALALPANLFLNIFD